MTRFVAGAALLVSVLSLCACAVVGLPPGATAQSQILHADWMIFFYSGLAVTAVVTVLILVPLFLWRRRDEKYPPQFRRNDPLEISYTIIPLLIVVVLFIVGFGHEAKIESLAASPDVVVNVTAYDWSWRFQYPQSGIDIVGTVDQPPELVLPLNETTRIDLTSADVNHAFWVPAFLFKRDAIAGMTNRFDWRPIREGTFRGECAEFCGLQHAEMTFTVRVVSPQAFQSWLRRRAERS